jgi:dienelactone hydrolase
LRTVPILLLALGAAGCDPAGSATALFQVPRDGVPQEFYALPFPSDVRRDDAGHPMMDGYPRPVEIIGRYVDAVASLDGFGTNGAIFTRFSAPIDEATLPTPEASVDDPTSSVYLVDVDPDSPTRGQRWPLRFRFQTYAGWTIGDNWLSALPYPGFPLADGTTYALVITDRVRAAGGGVVEPDVDWLRVRNTSLSAGVPEAAIARAQERYRPLWEYLDEPGGDERADVVSAAVFTTQRATAIMGRLRARIWGLPAPVARDVVEIGGEGPDFIMFEGAYDAPNFQTGTVPYRSVSDGGDIVDDTDGLPKVQGTEPIRFSFTIPRGPMPASGWPVVLYAHGTGGDYRSYLADRTAARLAQQGLAVISIDQVLHGPRNPGGDPELDFFNFQNPYAARNNPIQGAVDDFSLLRLVLEFRYQVAKGSQVPYPQVRFDPARISFFGHSQGGLTGPPFLAYEPRVQGAVLSGAGGSLYYALLHKTEPVDVAGLVAGIVLDNPLDEFNPVLALLQTWIERSDTVNYGPLLTRQPVLGADGQRLRPKAIYQSMGLVDHFTPVPNIETLAVAIGGNLVGPELEPIEGLALRHRDVRTAPVEGNVDGTTAILAQYRASGGDGHFVVFNVPAAQRQSAQFLGTLAARGTATLVTPQ